MILFNFLQRKKTVVCLKINEYNKAILKCYLQKQTIKIVEKSTKQNIKKGVRFKIEPPSIFALPLENEMPLIVWVDKIFKSMDVLSLVETINNNTSLTKSFSIYLNLLDHLRNLDNKEKFYIEHTLSPKEILDNYKNNTEKNPIEKKKINKIITYYNINYLIALPLDETMDLTDYFGKTSYYYLSKEGGYIIDEFLQTNMGLLDMPIENTKFKFISFEKEKFDNLCKNISGKIKENLKIIADIRDSSNKAFHKILFDTLAGFELGRLRSFVRCILTVLYERSSPIKNADVKEFHKTISTNKAKKYEKSEEAKEADELEEELLKNCIKLEAVYPEVIIALGRIFFDDFYASLNPQRLKACRKNPELDKTMQFILENISLDTKISPQEFSNFKYTVLATLNPKTTILDTQANAEVTKDTEKITTHILSKLNKTTLSLPTPNIILRIMDQYYTFMAKPDAFWQYDKKHKSYGIKILDAYLRQQSVKIFASIGDILLLLLNPIIVIDHKRGSTINIDKQFFWATKQQGKVPFFGLKQITTTETNIVSNNQKFINRNAAYLPNQPMFFYNPAYHLIESHPEFIKQLQDSSETYVCKLNRDSLLDFMLNIKDLQELHKQEEIPLNRDRKS